MVVQSRKIDRDRARENQRVRRRERAREKYAGIAGGSTHTTKSHVASLIITFQRTNTD